MNVRERLRLNMKLKPKTSNLFLAADIQFQHLPDNAPSELRLRQLYLDLESKVFDLRIGKQIIVWGNSDGIVGINTISPLDLREYITQNIEDIKIGISALKTNFYFRDHILEVIFVPIFKGHLFPEKGDIWYVDPYKTFDKAEQFPKNKLKNSEFGTRIQFFFQSST